MIRIGKMKISLPMILFMYVLIYNPPLLAPLYRSNSVWLVMLPSVLYVLMHRKELKEFTGAEVCVHKDDAYRLESAPDRGQAYETIQQVKEEADRT